jgi:hypothetical protein
MPTNLLSKDAVLLASDVHSVQTSIATDLRTVVLDQQGIAKKLGEHGALLGQLNAKLPQSRRQRDEWVCLPSASGSTKLSSPQEQ